MIDVVSVRADRDDPAYMQKRVTERLGAGQGHAMEVVPFQGANVGSASYLLTGTITRKVGKPGTPVQIKLALTELRTGKVAAQATAIARDDGLDWTPLPTDQDSPVLASDKVVDGYVRTTATAPGEKADPYYLEHVVVAPVINNAADYICQPWRYEDALAQYKAAAASPTGEQLRVLIGVYLSLVRLNRMPEAEAAFGKIVSYGIANKQLGVKFLFNPGSTVFWFDPQVSGQYGMWLDQLATRSTEARVCMTVVGHTSHTGSQEFNDALSMERGGHIREQPIAKSPALSDRTRPDGKGFLENIVGTGTDNAVDALDRRVEFKVSALRLTGGRREGSDRLGVHVDEPADHALADRRAAQGVQQRLPVRPGSAAAPAASRFPPAAARAPRWPRAGSRAAPPGSASHALRAFQRIGGGAGRLEERLRGFLRARIGAHQRLEGERRHAGGAPLVELLRGKGRVVVPLERLEQRVLPMMGLDPHLGGAACAAR